MTFDWKKTSIVLIDCILGVYLLLAITAFNRPDDVSDVCTEVNIQIADGAVKGFLDVQEIKRRLQRAHIYPLGERMSQVSVRQIEETIAQNPFVKNAQCYKTQTGHIHIVLEQRLPVIHIKADNGEDYYVDEQGTIMPRTMLASDLVVATGAIKHKYAQEVLCDIGRFLMDHPLWNHQVEQFNVLPDGTLEMVPRVGDHVVYLGAPRGLEEKLNRLEKFYKYGLSEAGWNKYSYINLEFGNQIICKKRKIKNT